MGMVQYYQALSPSVNPVCSICIANYNGVKLLRECLDSVLNQQGDLSIEIIIHDDASTDDSVTWLREAYPQVRILASKENVGFCISNNRMVAQARGEYILLLNNDAALYPDALSTLLDAAHKQSPSGILTLPQYDWTTGALVDRGCLLDTFYNPVPNLDPGRLDVAMTIGACMFLSRALWNDLQGFPEWFESIGEDLYLCCLTRLRGGVVQVVSGSGYRHRQGVSFGGNRVIQGQLQTTYRRRRLSERNKTSAMVVCTPTAIVWVLLTLHLIALMTEGGVMTLLKRDFCIWHEIYSPTIKFVLRRKSPIFSHRRKEQSRMKVSLHIYLSTFVLLPQKLRLLIRHGIPSIDK